MSLEKTGPDLLVHQDLPHTGISSSEFTKSHVSKVVKKKKRRKEYKQL